jgi:hypothetical protein
LDQLLVLVLVLVLVLLQELAASSVGNCQPFNCMCMQAEAIASYCAAPAARAAQSIWTVQQ